MKVCRSVPRRNQQHPSRHLCIEIFGSCKYDVLTKESKIFLTTCILIPQRHGESNPHPLYHWSAGGTTVVPVCCVVGTGSWNFVKYKGDWLSIKFCENDSFQKLFLFSENTFQYLGGIAQDISVSHVDSCRSLSSANRQRSTSPISFVCFTQPCDQHDRNVRTIRKSAAQWRGRRARGYRKLILRANLLYVPNIKM